MKCLDAGEAMHDSQCWMLLGHWPCPKTTILSCFAVFVALSHDDGLVSVVIGCCCDQSY